MGHEEPSMDLATAALTWHDAGCSIIPVRADGTKRPSLDWESFMQVRASRERIFGWFKAGTAGIGIVCGKISGNLEMLELEGRATNADSLDKILDAVNIHGCRDLWEQLIHSGYAEWTPSGGLHFLYRIADHEVPGNTKIARRPATEDEITEQMDTLGLPREKVNKTKVLSETRGEGGFVVVAPSGGTVHPTGDSWSVCAGNIGTIPTITWAQRESLTAALHEALDQMPAAPAPAPRPKLSEHISGQLSRPGDDYNERADWRDILEPHGWDILHIQGGTTYWVRPGKKKADGHSATTGRAADADRLYVFSSSTVFDTEVPYTKFAAYALLEHHNDFAAAARALRRLGYGAPAATASPYVATPVPTTTLAPVEQTGQALDTQDLAALPAPAETPETALERWDYKWQPPKTSAAKIIATEASYAGMGTLFGHAYGDSFRYIEETKKWLYFNGVSWTIDRSLDHVQAAVELLNRSKQAAIAHENEEWIKWTLRAARAASPDGLIKWAKSNIKIRATVDSFDQQRHLVAVNNGTLDLHSNTFQPSHDPKHMLSKQLRLDFDPHAQAPRWNRFLEQVLPSQDVRSYVQRAAGLTLLGDAKERALFLLHGKSGTGKSQFVRVMELLFGDYAATSTSAAFNEQSKRATVTNDLNDLRGKRFVSLSELDQDERLNEALVKRMTGGDTAVSRALYQENQQWRVEFMLWMATNYLPRLNSDDNAIWRRVKPIEFPHVAADNGGEVRGLAESIFAEEASGILNWLLDGVRGYQEHGLEDLQEIKDAVATYRHDVDTVAQFIDAAVDEKMLIKNDQGAIPVRQLHHIYQTWCTNNGIKWLGERRFGQRMLSLGYQKRKAESANVWTGLSPGGWLLGGMRQ